MTATPIDFGPRQLGKLAPRADPRTLRFDAALRPQVIQAPPECGWTRQMAGWGMLGNDTVGDCVEAAQAHQDALWTSLAQPGSFGGYTDADVLAAYAAITGWDGQGPGNGTVYLDALNYWRQTGIKGRRIYAYGSLDWRNTALVKAAIYALGGVQVGLGLPAALASQPYWWYDQRPQTGEWAPGSWGYHAVAIVDYTEYWYWCITWGQLWPLSIAFVQTYADEMYACLSEDWLAKPTAPNGIDLQTIGDQLAAVTR